jgi:NitT/TauT family transport system substrate-binding protein
MRTARPISLLLAASLAVFPLAGCTTAAKTVAMPRPGPKMGPPAMIRIGTLPVEDALPLWVSQHQGVFDKVGLSVRIVPFSSVLQRNAAFKSGAIDGFVGDIPTVLSLQEQGFKNRIVTVCLGATPAQGRVGLLTSPRSGLRFSAQLANVSVATSADSMEEFVLDRLARTARIPWVPRKHYIRSAARRYRLLMEGTIKAAVLPEPYLTLATREHAYLMISDTRRGNLSQTVLAFSDDFLTDPEGASAVNRLLGAWDTGSSAANSRRKVFRPLLVQWAGWPSSLAVRYRMNTYPHHQLPTKQQVWAILSWMRTKDLLGPFPRYADVVWTPKTTAAP